MNGSEYASDMKMKGNSPDIIFSPLRIPGSAKCDNFEKSKLIIIQ